MAYADWLIKGLPDAVGEAVTHASLANPLSGHGTHCRSAKRSGVNQTNEIVGRCLDAAARDVPATTSTFASAFVRIEEASSGGAISSAGVFLAHDDVDPTMDARGDTGYNLTLYNRNGVTTLRLYCTPPPGSGGSGTYEVTVATLAKATWYRIKLERRYVDATHLRIICSYADPSIDEDDYTVVHDETLASSNTAYYAGDQATMGWRVHNSFNSVNCGYIDGWRGGTLA